MNVSQFTKLEERYINARNDLILEALRLLGERRNTRQVAKELDLGYQVIYRIQTGENKTPSSDILKAIIIHLQGQK